MSTYEIKYQKLIDAIKKLRDSNPSDENIQNWVNDNVLELKKNENEKIKNEIASFLGMHLGTSTPPAFSAATIQKWIDWLENQGEKGEQKEVNLVEVLKHYPRETGLYSPLYGKLWLAEVDEQNGIITCYKYYLSNGCTRATLDQEETVSFYSNGTTGLPDCTVSKDCMLFLYDIKKQGEQKHVLDFKADDWHISEVDGKIHKITSSDNASIKTVNEFADKYSNDIWEKLMDNFKNIENYHIGCNDVSDIVLNAIINTYNWFKKQVDVTKLTEEDENIRNEIKRMITYFYNSNLFFTHNYSEDNMIAWLEKQGEQAKDSNKEYWRGYREGKQEIRDKYSEYDIVAKWQKNLDGNKPSKNHSVLMKTTHGIAEGEWNGEQWIQYRWSSKLNDKDVLYWVELSDLKKQKSDDTDANIVSECLKKTDVEKATMATMDRQKPADKFNEGDWIVYNGYTYRIESVTEDGYCNNHQGFIPKTCEKEMKLWTIEDAKYGDILVSRYNHPFIYNGTFNAFSVGAIGGIECEGVYFILGKDGFFWTDNINIKPATKELCNALFEKMHYAGYQWDDKKKELKKIEEETADNVEPKFDFKVGQWIVATGHCVYLITKIDGFKVTLIDADGNECVFYVSSLDDSRLWTIQDAKDGDVLACDDAIIIVKNIDAENGTTYISYEYGGTSIENGVIHTKSNGWYLNGKWRPGTKEERAILFRKMKEAGYDFDFEKKELKKVGQKSDGWSKDDEHKLNGICSYLNCSDSPEGYTKWIDWLKSLKQRI